MSVTVGLSLLCVFPFFIKQGVPDAICPAGFLSLLLPRRQNGQMGYLATYFQNLQIEKEQNALPTR